MTRRFFRAALFSALLLVACQKAPVLSITGPTNIELSADGSSGTITFTANRDWTISTSDSWVSVSPSRGEASDGQVAVAVRCGANTTYEDRTATVTIKMEDLTQTVTVKQPANLGIILPSRSYNLESGASSIAVEVQANVAYSVSTSTDWIKQTGTKGLTPTTYIFSIEENQTYDAREGTITIKSQNSGVADQVITVKQAQKDALIVKDKSFDMPYGGGEIEFKVEANIDFDVKPDVDWIHYLETKALSNSTVRLSVDENPTYEAREGKIEVKQKNGSLSHTITVKEAGRIAVTSITLDQTSIKLKEGETATLVATVKPDNATDKTVAWGSSDEAIAVVDANGIVTAVKEGTATITAQAGEKKATCEVTVKNEVLVSSLDLDKSTLSLVAGQQVTLVATVGPEDAIDKTVIWSSTNEQVATVDDKGKVTAIGKGHADILALSGTIGDYCTVFVKAKDYGVPSGGVDLGLSVVWSEKNYGASSPSDVGGYYLWGDPTGMGKIGSFNPPTINSISGENCDIARRNLGKGWRLPTREEISELFTYCGYGASSYNGVNGIDVTGPNGESIFIPLSGMGFPADGPVGSYSIMSQDKGFMMTGDSYTDASGHFAYVCCFEHGASYSWSSYNVALAVFPVRPVYELLEEEDETPDTSDNIAFADKSLEFLIVQKFDTNGDGSLSYSEAAAITSLAGVFPNADDGSGRSIDYTSFDELQFFTGLTEIHHQCFSQWKKLSSIVLPATITSINALAFRNCVSLTSIVIPDSVTEIASDAFTGCSGLRSFTIPEKVTYIETRVFLGCSGLTSISIPEGVTSIGENAFDGCSSLTTIDIPKNVTNISSGAFARCSSLTSISIPAGVSSINSNVFQSCSGLTSITIPESITFIGKYAFLGCSGLSSITIPESITNIYYGAFDGCSGLSSITVLCKSVPRGQANMFYDTNDCPIYVREELVEIYKSSSYWSEYADRIQAIPAG